jgi:hypothetical protein
MAYGGPDSLADVEPYIMDVRNLRPTSAELIEEMRSRYRAIGGRSPILEHTRAQARALGEALRDGSTPMPVYIGMRHWHPYIALAFDEMRTNNIERVVGLVMAPHQSRMSVGAYFRRVEEAAGNVEVLRIESWHLMVSNRGFAKHSTHFRPVTGAMCICCSRHTVFPSEFSGKAIRTWRNSRRPSRHWPCAFRQTRTPLLISRQP